CLDWLGAGSGAAEDRSRGAVDGEELVGAGRCGKDELVSGREVDGERGRADGNFGGEHGGAWVQNPDVAGTAADPPDLSAFGMLAHVGDAGADVDLLHGLERYKVDDGDGAVGGGDVGVNAQARTKERRAMFAKKNDDEGSELDDEEEVEAETFEVVHWMKEFYMRWSGNC